MLKALYNFFTSLRLTVVLLSLGIILIFWGTLAQVKLGLYQAQNEFFRSLFIYWKPGGGDLRIPIFPGGYLVGCFLIINLFSAHLRYYKSSWRKIGIALIHLGIVMLLLGQLLTDVLSRESYMIIREGQGANYSQSNSRYELAIIDTTDTDADKVTAINDHQLKDGAVIPLPGMPFSVRIKTFYHNASLSRTNLAGYEMINARHGEPTPIWWTKLPKETTMDRRDVPAAIIELVAGGKSLGDFLVSGFFQDSPMTLSHEGRNYVLSLRAERSYKPFTLHLVDFKFDRYPGTEIPKNFSSLVRLDRPETGESREILIRMNEPLRYGGETFFQADWDKSDEKGTVLQVVRNPSWATPYLACCVVSLGMLLQFAIHLFQFLGRRNKA